jgi:L-threonylcarbamoyladenylate synthase
LFLELLKISFIGEVMDQIEKAIQLLRRGEVVAYPTETCYGLGADATNEGAVAKVFKLKGREKGKPISILLTREMMDEYVVAEGVEDFLGKPITLVVGQKGKLAKNLCGDRVGFRLAMHPMAKKLVEGLGKPITATSANFSGDPPIYDPEKLDMGIFVVDGGVLPKVAVTRVYDVGEKKFLR